jgi:hypothetical protein
MEITRETARWLMIEKQRFGPRRKPARKEDILETVRALGCIQIDTINVIERAHYVTLWSRLGTHDKSQLDELAYRDKKLFEYWAHAASYVPMKDYRYFIRPMKMREEEMPERLKRWGGRAGIIDLKILDEVLEKIRKEGPLATKDFEHKRTAPSRGWWDWKPAKVALEVLYGAGLLMVSHRENFQRHYDLTDNVLPSGVDTEEPPEEERIKFYITRTMNALGLVKSTDIRGYFTPSYARYRKYSRELPSLLEEMNRDGEAIRYEVEDEKPPYFCLPEDADMLENDDSSPGYEGVNLLNPFDNSLWDKKRVKNLFDFEAKLEAYTPAAQRKYGYYYLAILHGDRLIGRIIPKMDREKHTLIINSIWHEPWFQPEEAFEDAFAKTLESFAEFNGADKIELAEEKPRIG